MKKKPIILHVCVCIYYINSEICVATSLGSKKKCSRLKGWLTKWKTVSVCLCSTKYTGHCYSSSAFIFSIRFEIMNYTPVPFIVLYLKILNTWPHTNTRLSGCLVIMCKQACKAMFWWQKASSAVCCFLSSWRALVSCESGTLCSAFCHLFV